MREPYCSQFSCVNRSTLLSFTNPLQCWRSPRVHVITNAVFKGQKQARAGERESHRTHNDKGTTSRQRERFFRQGGKKEESRLTSERRNKSVAEITETGFNLQAPSQTLQHATRHSRDK